MYWNIGRRIFEEEQQGKQRAEYGSYLIRRLAERLEPEYGSGFGVRQLKLCRQFYRLYPIGHTLCAQLNWSQYKLLMYVNYYDRCEKLKEEGPTLGILLCVDKNDTVVRMSLPENNQSIVASRYKLCMPSEQQLVKEVEDVKKKIEQR